MSGVTLPSGAQRVVTVASVATASAGAGTTVSSVASGGVHVPVIGELPYTGLPLALVMASAALFITAGLALRLYAYTAKRRSRHSDDQPDTA